MSEIIVSMGDHLKMHGGQYVRDLVRCKDCKHYVAINNGDHGHCGSPFGRKVYDDDYCSDAEPVEGW